MCYDGKCLHCIQVETSAKIWAIFSIIWSCTGLGMCFKGLTETKSNVDHNMKMKIMYHIVMFMGINFLFSIVLLAGVIMKHSGCVKAYFIYGVVKSVLFANIILTLLCIKGNPDTILILIVGIVFGLYSLILWMVRMTYVKFSES